MAQTTVGWTFYKSVICLSTTLLAIASFANAASIFEVTLVDKNQQPVPNAVIAIPYVNSMPPANASLHKHTAIMDQVNIQYEPKVLLVQKNQWVDFPNSDNVRHHVYSFSSPKPFEIKMFAGGEAEPVQFDNSGIVVLGCNIHDSMIGYIYVADTEHTYLSDADGKVNIDTSIFTQLDITQRENVVATVWHANLSATNAERQSISLNVQQSSQILELNIALKNDTQKPTNGFRSKFSRGN